MFPDKSVWSSLKTSHGHLKEVPKRFEVNDKHALKEFERYINDINDLVKPKKLTVKYKVKVEVAKPLDSKKMGRKKGYFKKAKKEAKFLKTKKYNVPLKKTSMQLSTYEMILRRLAEDNVQTSQEQKRNSNFIKPSPTTEPQQEIVTIKQTHLGKYKPEIGRVKTKYQQKRVKPVRIREVTL